MVAPWPSMLALKLATGYCPSKVRLKMFSHIRAICRHHAGVNNGKSIFNLTLLVQYSASNAGADGFGGTLVTEFVVGKFRIPQTPLGAHTDDSGILVKSYSRRAQAGQVFHLIEQPIDGICSGGPRPVSATCFIASKRSRRPFGIGVVREASSLPRYYSSSCALKPKKSGVH
jgi:hypothetical protein